MLTWVPVELISSARWDWRVVIVWRVPAMVLSFCVEFLSHVGWRVLGLITRFWNGNWNQTGWTEFGKFNGLLRSRVCLLLSRRLVGLCEDGNWPKGMVEAEERGPCFTATGVSCAIDFYSVSSWRQRRSEDHCQFKRSEGEALHWWYVAVSFYIVWGSDLSKQVRLG